MHKKLYLISITFLLLFVNCEDSINNNNSLTKYIQLLKPNGGEIFLINDTINIIWSQQNIEKFSVKISLDNGSNWIVVANDLMNISEYNLIIKKEYKTENCLIKIEDFLDESIFDITDKAFRILNKPEIRIFAEHSTNYTNRTPLCFSSDDNFIFSYSPGNNNNFNTNVWHVNSGKLINKLPTNLLSTHPNKNIVVGHNIGKDKIELWTTNKSEKISSFSTWYPFDAKISNNGKYLAIARTRWITIWEVETMSFVTSITVRENPSEDNFHTIEFSPDNKILASANDKLRLYNVSNGTKIKEINRVSAFSIKFSPDGTKILAGGSNSKVDIWDIDSGERILEFNVDNERVFSIDISSNGEKLLIGTKGELILWDLVNNRQESLIYQKGTADFLGVAFSNNSRFVAGKAHKNIVVYGPIQ